MTNAKFGKEEQTHLLNSAQSNFVDNSRMGPLNV